MIGYSEKIYSIFPTQFKMIFSFYKTLKHLSIYSVAILFVFQAPHSFASPAACQRNIADKFLLADLVVEAKVIKSRRWKEGHATLHLVAKYQTLDVLKGEVKKDSVQIVTTTCLKTNRPNDGLLGYPRATPYCPKGLNISLTGVDSKTGHPRKKGENALYWLLFVKKDFRKGAPQLTWKEVSDTSFQGGCSRGSEKEIPKNLQEEFRRMIERDKIL
jgi:hypothetical protein